MSDSIKAAQMAAATVQGEALGLVTFSDDRAEMKASCDGLRKLLAGWQALDKAVTSTLRGQLQLIQARCQHAGAQRGYNERDGSWMNACPTCGKTE